MNNENDKEVVVKTLSSQKRKILKSLFVKLQRTIYLEQSKPILYLAQDAMSGQPSIAFGITPFEYREGKNEVTAIGFRFGISESYLAPELKKKYLKEFLEFRDSLEPRTVYRFRKFSDREIISMLGKEGRGDA